MENKEKPRGVELASPELWKRLQKKRIIVISTPGSDEEKLLTLNNAHANVGGESLRHIILKEDARKIEILEEFLHGTQFRTGMIQHVGDKWPEIHVKRFMIRHARLLGISEEDVAVLWRLLGEFADVRHAN